MSNSAVAVLNGGLLKNKKKIKQLKEIYILKWYPVKCWHKYRKDLIIFTNVWFQTVNLKRDKNTSHAVWTL